MTPEAERWMSFAETDLKVARHLLETFHPVPVETICYHCQQCAEKATKAMMIQLGEPGGLPKKHDISFLLNQISTKIDIDERIYDYADLLTPYGIAVRYPNDLGLEIWHAEKAVNAAGDFFLWADSMIRKEE